jgi:hypothetical protein
VAAGCPAKTPEAKAGIIIKANPIQIFLAVFLWRKILSIASPFNFMIIII